MGHVDFMNYYGIIMLQMCPRNSKHVIFKIKKIDA